MDEVTTQIHQILTDYDRSWAIRQITRPSNGLSKSVYFLSCCCSTADVELVLKFTKPGETTEVLFYQLLARSSAFPFPVPRILKFEAHYYLSSKLIGLPFSQQWASLNDEQRVHIYRELGTLVGELHKRYTFERCGYLQGEQFPSWTVMLRGIVQKRVGKFQGTIFEELAKRIERYLVDHFSLIHEPIVPRLLHMDLHAGNILVTGTGITGLLDAEDALIGHNEYELMRIEKAHFGDDPSGEKYRQVFMSNYQTLIELDDGYEARRGFYSLTRELVGMQCLIEYGNEYASVEEEKQRIENNVEHIIGNVAPS